MLTLPATILFVEDDELILVSQYELLSLVGYNVLTARSAQEALEILQTTDERVDILFADINMPGHNGYWLAEQVAEKYPAIKVVLATGYASYISQDFVKGEARFPLIMKPYTLQTTIGHFNAALANRIIGPDKPAEGEE